MPPEGFADPITSDGIGFCSNIPISELIKRVTRAIEASDVASTPSSYENHGRGDSHKSESNLDQIPAMRGGSGKVGLAMRPNARSQNDS